MYEWENEIKMGNEEMGMIWNAELIILLSLGLGTNLDIWRSSPLNVTTRTRFG